jgi:hypothetical protein
MLVSFYLSRLLHIIKCTKETIIEIKLEEQKKERKE